MVSSIILEILLLPPCRKEKFLYPRSYVVMANEWEEKGPCGFKFKKKISKASLARRWMMTSCVHNRGREEQKSMENIITTLLFFLLPLLVQQNFGGKRGRGN